MKNLPLELRLRVLSAIDYAPGNTTRERIKNVSQRTFVDSVSQVEYRFTWRTISTWLYRFKKHGMTTLQNKQRGDKNTYRKIQPNELSEAINDILPALRTNKTGVIPKMTLYRQLLTKNYFLRTQLSQTSFYRIMRENNLINPETNKKLRQSFCMQFANELWQADTMYGPSIKQPDGKWRKTFLIAFIDDASRLITHGEFFYADNTANMIDAFRSALYKRGKPERLYFDNGANYKSKEILQACVRLNILLSHAPIRDGSAKGKIERFFRGFRDRFLVLHQSFESLEQLNALTHDWIENQYNHQPHSTIQMKPIDRFVIDHSRFQFLTNDEFTDEAFFVEEPRKVSKTNCFSINSKQWECPVDLREKTIQVRFARNNKNLFIVYFNNKRMGNATPVNLIYNANYRKAKSGENT